MFHFLVNCSDGLLGSTTLQFLWRRFSQLFINPKLYSESALLIVAQRQLQVLDLHFLHGYSGVMNVINGYITSEPTTILFSYKHSLV